jgi:hypothetical protein
MRGVSVGMEQSIRNTNSGSGSCRGTCRHRKELFPARRSKNGIQNFKKSGQRFS